jgi:CheY-like chemotaxis protein
VPAASLEDDTMRRTPDWTLARRLALIGMPPLALGPDFGPHRSPRSTGTGHRPIEDPGLKFFFDQAADPMLLLDEHHLILDLNRAATEFLGRPIEALRGVSALEVDVLARMLAQSCVLQRVRTDPPPVVAEVSVTDAEDQPVQSRIEALACEGDRTLLHLQNTTAVLRSRTALRAMEHLHHAFFEALPAVAWSMALPEERLVDISPAVEPMFGWEPAAFRELPGLWDELAHPADRERVRAEFRRGVAAGRPFEIGFTGLHRDHRDLPYLVNRVIPVADEHGWVERCEGLIEDRSGQQRLQAALHTAEAHLKHTLDAVSSGVLVLEASEGGVRVTLCNHRFAEILHLDQPLRAGTPLASLPEGVRHLLTGPGPDAGIERRVLSEDARDEIVDLAAPHRVIRHYSAPLRGDLDQVTGRIVAVEDVTASWLARRRLTQSQKMESFTRLAGGVAHDFNNLIGAILGFASLLAEHESESGPRREAIDGILVHAERATRLTQALLTFSRNARFERIPVCLNRVVDESYPLLRATLDPGVAIDIDLARDLPPLMGDAVLLQQLVVHLVQEAGLTLASGATIELATRLEAEAVDAPGSPGAPGRERRRIVLSIGVRAGSPRAPSANARVPGAEPPPSEAAIALSVIEDIARVHGGWLRTGPAASPALYVVGLPIRAPEQAMLLAPDEAMAKGEECILMVDDEPGLLTVVKMGLEQRGFHVITAESGEEALDVLRSRAGDIDLVLLDLSMPGLSGERVLQTLRDSASDLPVVIASGYATLQSQQAWTSAGAQGFVAKPYRIRDLAARLREILDHAERRAA